MERRETDCMGNWISFIDSIEKRKHNGKKELFVRGWAFNTDGKTGEVQVCRNGKSLGVAVIREEREDVAIAHKRYGDVTECGFSCVIPYKGLRPMAEIIVGDRESSMEMFCFGSTLGVPFKKRMKRIKKRMKFRIDKFNENKQNRKQKQEQTQEEYKDPYLQWKENHQLSNEQLARQREEKFAYEPKISIVVPAYRTPEQFLRQMIESVQSQTYANWELCIGDGSQDNSISGILAEYAKRDSRVKYKLLEENFGISGNTNGALSIAGGDYIGLLDHDDILTKDALYEVVKRINDTGAEVLYTDEDKVTMDLKEYFEPNFKPDFNQDLLRCSNYICHFFVVKKEIIDRVGSFNPECDGSQDFDFILRCTKAANHVSHIAKVLYNWRCHPNSMAGNPETKAYCYEAGRRALELALAEEQAKVEIESYYGYYRVSYPLIADSRVDIMIIEREDTEKTKLTVDSLRHQTAYDNYEIKVLRFEESLAKTINEAAAASSAKYLFLLEAGMTIEQKDWLERLLSNCQRKDVAAVGAKILKQGKKVAHSGKLVGGAEIERDMFSGNLDSDGGYTGRMLAQQDVLAHTWKGMLINRKAFTQVGGFERKLTEKYADTDLCLRLAEQGKRIIYTPYVSFSMFRLEYMMELDEDLSAKTYMKEKWEKRLAAGDPYDNPNFDRAKACFQL